MVTIERPRQVPREPVLVLRQSKIQDLNAIMRLVNNEANKKGALLTVTDEEVTGWIQSGLSLVATFNKQIIGHQAISIWPESKWAELRATVVDQSHNGKNISFELNLWLMEICKAQHEEVPVFVVMKNKASNGNKVFESLGFSPVLDHGQVPSELFSIGQGQKWSQHPCAIYSMKASEYDPLKAAARYDSSQT